MAKVLRITSARPDFMRGGHPHPKEPTDYALDFFTKDQLKAIRAEPMLTVEEVEADGKQPLLRGTAAAPLILMGSDLLRFALSPEKTIKLGEVIAIAHNQSDLSPEDWNGLSDGERAELLQTVLDDILADARALLERQPKASVEPGAAAEPGSGAAVTPAPGEAGPPKEETPAQKRAREKKEKDKPQHE